MPSALGGLVEGLWGSVDRQRDEAYRREQDAGRQEAAVLALLANSDDPDLQAAALSGMVDLASPKRKMKGLRGFFGEVERSPALEQIRTLLGTPVKSEQVTTGLPSRGMPVMTGAAAPQVPARAGGAALPGRSLVDGGGPGPQAPASPVAAPAPAPAPASAGPVGQPPPGPSAFTQQRGTPAVGRTDVVSRPRRAFLSPEERVRRDTIAREQAQVEGEVAGLVAAGFSDQEARELIKQKYARLRGGLAGRDSYAEGEIIPDPDSPTGFSQILYNRYRPEEQIRIPAVRKSALSSRAPNIREQIAAEMFGREGEDPRNVLTRLTPTELQQLDQEVRRRDITEAGQRARRVGDEDITTARGRELAKPVGLDFAAEQQVDPTMALQELQGIIPVSTEHLERLNAAKGLDGLISSEGIQLTNPDGTFTTDPSSLGIVQLINRVFPEGTGVMGGLKSAAVLKGKQLSRDPEYAALEAKIEVALGNVATVLSQEKGRKTEEDVKRARAALANLKSGLLNGDNKETALVRARTVVLALDRIKEDVKSVTQQLQERARQQQQGAAGQPPPGATAAPAAPAAGTPPPGQAIQHPQLGWIVLTKRLPDGRQGYRPALPSEIPQESPR